MDRPTLTLNGRTIEMPEPKARAWRRWAEFDQTKKDLRTEEYIEAHCRMLAELYGGQVSEEELLDGLELSDVMKEYRAAADYLMQLLYAKFEAIGKNSGSSVGDGAI